MMRIKNNIQEQINSAEAEATQETTQEEIRNIQAVERISQQALKFKEWDAATNYANGSRAMLVVMTSGSSSPYLVVTMREAAILEKFGYTWAGRNGTR